MGLQWEAFRRPGLPVLVELPRLASGQFGYFFLVNARTIAAFGAWGTVVRATSDKPS